MAGIWKQFTQREASPLIQFIKYAICGGGAVTVHIIIFYLLSWLIVPARIILSSTARRAMRAGWRGRRSCPGANGHGKASPP